MNAFSSYYLYRSSLSFIEEYDKRRTCNTRKVDMARKSVQRSQSPTKISFPQKFVRDLTSSLESITTRHVIRTRRARDRLRRITTRLPLELDAMEKERETLVDQQEQVLK